MSTLRLVLAGIMILEPGTMALAARCIGLAPARIVMCDDFDSYCSGGDPWPGYPPTDPPPPACADGSSSTSAPFASNWDEVMASCGFDMKIGGDQKWSLPFGMKYPAGIEDFIDVEEEQRVYDLRQGALAMAALRRGLPGATAVNGTTNAPLTLFFVIWLGGTGNQFGQYKDLYVELSLGGDRAPTDHVMSDNCSQIPCGGPSTGFPVVCQVANPLHPRPAHCPPISPNIRAALAFGLLSKVDMNPCHPEYCGTGAHHPQNNHPAFFDGHRWWVVKSGVGPANGDFSLTRAYHRFSMTITDSAVELRMWAPTATVSPYVTTLPRAYLGPFDRVRIGVGPGCILNGATGSCVPGTTDCINGSHGGNPWVDDVVLYDGVLVREEGACCLPTGGCGLRTAAECAETGGTFRGNSTVCSDPAARCCNDPAADIDGDGDADVDDFGVLQRCLGGGGAIAEGCECMDLTRNLVINENDLLRFIDCATRAGVAAHPACDD